MNSLREAQSVALHCSCAELSTHNAKKAAM